MTDPAKLMKYLAAPYTWGGRSFSGVDCWGLAMLWYATELGVRLGDYGYDVNVPMADTFADGSPFIAHAYERFERVDDPEPGDVVLLKYKSHLVNHCGVCIGGGEFLHAVEHVGVSVSTLHRWSRQIAGFYRFKE